MLDRLDEYPVHQTPESLSRNPLGPNAYDRYFFNGYEPAGTDGADSVFLGAALGVYPNRGVIDAAFSLSVDGVQHCVYASTELVGDRGRTEVGPIRLEIVEPMRSHRLVVDTDDLGCDITFHASTPVVEEPRFTNVTSGIGAFDYTRYTQFGRWSGTVSAGSSSIDVGQLVGCRDRSWGQRPVGGPIERPPTPPQFFWLWAPLNFDDGAIHFDVNDNEDGSRWHESGFVVPGLGANDDPLAVPVVAMRSVDYDLTIAAGTRWAERATLRFQPWNGDAFGVTLTPVQRFQMRGLGYGHPQHRHGSWQGHDVVATDRIVLADVDPTDRSFFHVQQLVDAEAGGRVGRGVLEVLAIGPHRPTGLDGVFDVRS